jgi:antitoxin component of MazEF toxin-antitoxin module
LPGHGADNCRRFGSVNLLWRAVDERKYVVITSIMIKKLTTIGNSYGLVIDKAILEILRITPETELELSTDGRRLIIEPIGKAPKRRPSPPVSPTAPKSRGREPRFGFPKKQPW